MSEADVAVVRRMWDAFLRGDGATATGVLDHDVEWDGTNLPDGAIAHGRAAAADHIRRWAEVWETWEVELEEVVDADEGRVIVFFREWGRSKAGVDVDERHSELYVVRDGRIVYRKGFREPDDALVEAGLPGR